ncbi:MAG: XrtA/PEP-CTERM system-associated ATPase [Pseudomonadota bacterium]
MYEEYFGLSGQPFKLNPDPKFFYGSQSHNKAMAYLHYGLRQGEGFIVITGEIGAGKSMLIGHLLDQIDRSNVVAADLITPNLKREDLLAHILSAYRIEPAGDGPTAEIEAFEDYLFDQMNRGRRVLLIVDEAQNLPVDTLEELRVLSNLDYDGTPLFQVFLVGQPEFKKVIAGDGMEQLRQRIIASYHLEPLNPEESRAYIEHRLRVVGWTDNPTITDEAFTLVHEAARGIPRNINKLFNRLLLFSALEERDVVSGDVVRAVVDDLAAEDVSGSPMSLKGPRVGAADQTDATDVHDETVAAIERGSTSSNGEPSSVDQLDNEQVVDEQADNADEREGVDEGDLREASTVSPMPPPVVVNGTPTDDGAQTDRAADDGAAATDAYEANSAVTADGASEAAKSQSAPALRLVSDRDAEQADNVQRDESDDARDEDASAGADPFAFEDDLSESADRQSPATALTTETSDVETAGEVTNEGETAMRSTPEQDGEPIDEDQSVPSVDEPSISEPTLNAQRGNEGDLHADDDEETDDDAHSERASVNAEQPEENEPAVAPSESSSSIDAPQPVATAPVLEAAPMSVLDRLRAGKKASSDEQSVQPVAQTVEQAASDTTINDVADAIAAATEKARSQHMPLTEADAVNDVSDHVGDDRAALMSDDGSIASADFDASDAETLAPAPSTDPVTVERWRAALSRTVTSTRHDLKEAHSTALRLRARLRDLEARQRRSKEKVSENLKRAEALLSELRDAWK